MKKLLIKTQKKYPVFIDDSLCSFKDSVTPFIKGEKVAIISDVNVGELYANTIKKELKGKKVEVISVLSGENSKSLENVKRILNELTELDFDRNDTVITLGGGVVGDLGAFISSVYMRGINLISLPTSLLAMVDSSVGGKTAVNLEKGKNLCGTFYQPNAVFINLEFLATLPEREIVSGLGEIIKYSYLSKGKIKFDIIDSSLIYKCLKLKAKIVEKDERESGKRKLLNFGHTFSHAIERLSDFSLSHGECVIKGIYIALKISEKYFGISGLKEEFIGITEKLNLDVTCTYTKNELIGVIKSDKKRNGENVDLILIDKNKRAKIVSMPLTEINSYL